MNVQGKCAGCKKYFEKDKLVEEERTRKGEPVGTFFWCEKCLKKELDDWEKQPGEKEVKIKLRD